MTIKLVANEIIIAGINSGFGHLQLVNSATNQEIEVLIPAAISGSLMGNLDVREIQSHSDNTPNYLVAGKYRGVDINFGEVAITDAWDTLVMLRDQFSLPENKINYNTDQNSNSYINTLLDMVGISTSAYILQATPSEVNNFPGLTTNVMFNDEAFSVNISLTEGRNYLSTGIKNDIVNGLGGNDTINTWAGDDTLDGGAGNDVLTGGADDDAYIVSEGNDTVNADGVLTLQNWASSDYGITLNAANDNNSVPEVLFLLHNCKKSVFFIE